MATETSISLNLVDSNGATFYAEATQVGEAKSGDELSHYLGDSLSSLFTLPHNCLSRRPHFTAVVFHEFLC